MYIKCWGSRGSIPVSGKEYINYGGDTTCLEIRTKNDDIIIVDAGTGIRRLGNHLMEEERYNFHLIFTHAHWDHLMGFPFFKPIYLKKTEIKVYRCPFQGQYVEKMISKVLSPPNFPVKYGDISASIVYEKGCPDAFNIGSITIEPIPLSHPNGGNGYKFIEDGAVFVFLTDNELGFVHPNGLHYEDYLAFSEDADLLMHDAEYTPEEYTSFIEWGHSSYRQAVDLAIDSNVGRLGLFHISQDRSDIEVDEIVCECNRIISKRNKTLECFSTAADMIFEL
ncbi:MAG: MBL fold metallo-hydrolase [Desulfobacterales bacterium]